MQLSRFTESKTPVSPDNPEKPSTQSASSQKQSPRGVP